MLVARRSVRTAVLAALLLLAAGARLWGLRFGLPHTECRPDESVIVGLAAQFWSGDLNPRFFRYPTLQMYLTAAAFGADFVQGRARGLYPSLSAFREAMIADAPHFHLVARAVTALLGTLTVLAVYRLARAAAGPDTGLVAAFFLSLTYLHARDSHFATTDVTLTFFLTMAVLFVWRAYVRGRAADYAWAGALAGLAMSTKYLGLLVAFPLALGHLVRARAAGESALAPAELRKLALFGACLGLAFVAGTPFAVPEWRQLVADVQTDWLYARSGYWMVFGRAWSLHPRFSLWYGLGAPQLLAGVAGLALYTVRRPRAGAVLLAFPVAYCVLIARDRLVFARYAIPLLPFLCIGAAMFATALADRLAPSRPVARAILVGLAALATIAPSAASVVRFDRLLTRTDTRVLTQDWIEAHVTPADGLYLAADKWAAPQLPLSRAAIFHRYPGRDEAPRRRVLLRQAEGRARPGYDDWALEGTRFVRNGVATDELPRFILVPRSALVAYSGVSDELARLVADRYVRQQYFRYNVWGHGQLFDQQDAFYLPFAGLDGVERPGPNFLLFALSEGPVLGADGRIAPGAGNH